ncbi:transposase [Nocardia vinacea]|uniref:transposase n=1 Tax=Nocardia vinacea TaxID=96468 RepID=UPI0033F08626
MPSGHGCNPLLPRGKKAGRPPKWSKRQIIDGIRWRTRVGAPWRDVPDRYGTPRGRFVFSGQNLSTSSSAVPLHHLPSTATGLA